MTFLVGVIGSDEHAPSCLSPLDPGDVGDLPSDAVVLSASSPVLCPPPTSHAALAWISPHVLIPGLPRGVDPRPREISRVALMAVSAFRSPYAGGFFEAASRIFASSMAFATNETLGSLLFPFGA